MMDHRFGPVSLSFDTKVGSYLRQSMTRAEIDCLRMFFRTMEQDGIDRGFKQVVGDVWLVHACNHIIEIKLRSDNTGVVQSIYRDVSSSLPE
jgi:hypothetical protein